MIDQTQLQRLLNLKYRVVVEPIPEEEGGGFEAYVPTLGRGTCVGVGDTVEEAVQSVNECKHSLFMLWMEKGYPIPEPDSESSVTDEYNGRILLRTSGEMHEHLVRNAEKQGVSLNAYLNQIISRAQSLALFEEQINRVALQFKDHLEEQFGFVFSKQHRGWLSDTKSKIHVNRSGEVLSDVAQASNVLSLKESTRPEQEAA